jgi:hypothetical protein
MKNVVKIANDIFSHWLEDETGYEIMFDGSWIDVSRDVFEKWDGKKRKVNQMDVVLSSGWSKAFPSKWNPKHPPRVKIKPRHLEKTKLKPIGRHSFEDEEGNKIDSDDVQWHCPECKRKWNNAEHPCECGQESPYEIVKEF